MDENSDYFDCGYASLPGLVPSEVAAAYLSIMQNAMGATRELQHRFLFKENVVSKQSLEMLSDNFPFSLGFLWAMTPVMVKITGLDLLPSYAYARVYQQGATLSVHSDRASNEHSLNFTLGYSDSIPWAFSIEQNKLGEFEIFNSQSTRDFGDNPYKDILMQPGDAVAYRGTHFRHGRMTPNPNRWSAHLFLGWVDRNGPYKSNAFDGMVLPPAANFKF